MSGEKIAVVNMLCFSAAVDIFQFSNYSEYRNFAYIVILDSPKVNKKSD